MQVFWRAFLGALLGLALTVSAEAQVVTAQVQVTPNSGAYSAGQCLGSVNTLAGGAVGTIVGQLSIVDPTAANVPIDVWLFNSAPTGTYTDHTSCNIAAPDVAKATGIILGSQLQCAKDGNSGTGICQSSPGVLHSLAGVGGNVWALAVMQGTPTYGSGKTIYLNFKLLPE